MCTLTIHGLLHICDNIRFCGPVWTTWTFWMERYCGYLKAGLRSHSHPWMNLNNKILHKAYMEFTDVFYGLEDQQIFVSKTSIANKETTYTGCRCYLHFQIIIFIYCFSRSIVQFKNTTHKDLST